MVMQEYRRALTVEEARSLPPPTKEQLARRRAAWDALVDIGQKVLARRGGVPFTEEEFFEILKGDEDDCAEAAD